MYHCDTFDMSLAWRRLWKHMGARGAATTDVVGQEDLGWMLLAGRALDCGRCARPLRIGDCGLRKPKLGGEQPKLINSEWPIPDFLIS